MAQRLSGKKRGIPKDAAPLGDEPQRKKPRANTKAVKPTKRQRRRSTTKDNPLWLMLQREPKQQVIETEKDSNHNVSDASRPNNERAPPSKPPLPKETEAPRPPKNPTHPKGAEDNVENKKVKTKKHCQHSASEIEKKRERDKIRMEVFDEFRVKFMERLSQKHDADVTLKKAARPDDGIMKKTAPHPPKNPIHPKGAEDNVENKTVKKTADTGDNKENQKEDMDNDSVVEENTEDTDQIRRELSENKKRWTRN